MIEYLNKSNFVGPLNLKYFFKEAATEGVLWKKVFLEISQSSQENTCGRALFLIKLQARGQKEHLRATAFVFL